MNLRHYLLFVVAILGFHGLCVAQANADTTHSSGTRQANSGQAKPNFVIILTDDQGYGDLGCYGSKDVITPRIDRMAEEGARLTSFYMAAPYCTPSRAALMTGSYPIRVGMAGGVNLAADPKGLNPAEVTIAEVMKSAGYQTGMFGKWHLGDQPEFLPTRQGFDEFFGLPYSHDIHPFNDKPKHKFPPLPLLEGEEVIELDPDADFFTRRFTQRAVKFIEKNKDQPFFLYVAHPIPHRPVHFTDAYLEGVSDEVREALAQEKVTGKINYAVRDKLYFRGVNEIDWSVGKILDAIKEQGIDDNTLVIFTSDNGQARPPVGIGSPGPLKGSKGTTWEGGLRVPTVIRWPGKIAPGSDNDELLTAMDLLPTFANLAGAEIPTDRKIDGKDIWPVLTEGAESPHEVFFYYRVNSLQAVRSGKWKLQTGGPRQHGGGKALFNLAADIGETTNVAAQHPEVVERLRAYAKALNKDLKQNSRPAGVVKNPKPLTMSDFTASESGH
ncbi:sulfatase family protein [Novipirellula sp. SH528]|uniref:sulfatase family protein n=1 Tax=Novipirellula sp. SH528 TaxID=3454466 RepID=UPI003FA196B8